MKKILLLFTFLLVSSLVLQASHPFLTTLVNATGKGAKDNLEAIDIHLALKYSDNSKSERLLKSGEQYQVANFNDKILQEVLLTSPAKDIKGNLYGQCNQVFTLPISDVIYNITLADVAPYKVAAISGAYPMPAYDMPATSKIVCTCASEVNQPVTAAGVESVLVSTVKK